MKGIVIIFLLLSSLAAIKNVSAQVAGKQGFYMTLEENEDWLTRVKSKEKDEQVTAVHNRFFASHTTENVSSGEHSPLIVVNGVFLSIPATLKERRRQKLAKHLRAENIDEITILNKRPGDWGLEKPFSGVILIAVNDERTFRKIFRLRLK
jgi:hypothetical protein